MLNILHYFCDIDRSQNWNVELTALGFQGSQRDKWV